MAVESGQIQNGIVQSARGELHDDDSTVELDPVTAQDEKSLWIQRRPQADENSLPAQAARQDADPFGAGATLRDRYLIEDVIGHGGCAVIYRARDLRCETAECDGAHLSIKALRPELRGSQPAIARLKREFRCLRLLSHPNVVRVFDLDCHEGHWFEVMELLDGESLATLLHRRNGSRLPDGEALGILAACAEALACAHGHGVVHGDVKPDNIFLLRSGGLRLLDFGALSETTRDEELAGVNGEPVLATPAYASPQLLSGLQPEPRDDVFSLACIAFELLAGEHPFARIDARTAVARGLLPVTVAELGSARTATLATGLAARREDRPPGARELVARLREPDSATDSAAMADQAARRPAMLPPRRRRMPAVVTTLLLTLAAVTAAALVYFRTLPPSSQHDTPAHRLPIVPPAQPAPAPRDHRAQSAAPAKDDPSLSAPQKVSDEGAASAQTPVPAVGPTRMTTPEELQSVAFPAATLTVSRAAILAALPLRRSIPAQGRTRVWWRISEGTAVAERDFAGPTFGVVPFADGQQASTIFIPLSRDSRWKGEREFSVSLENVDAPAKLGTISTIAVRIR